MDILLINPKGLDANTFDIMPPLGLATIGCVLEKTGFSVCILDLEVKSKKFDLYRYIKDILPKIVGISGTSRTRFESFRIARTAKQVSDKIVTGYGGCHATFTAEDTLSHIREIDYIVHGEGELTMVELANFFIFNKGSVKDIKGISYRMDGKIVRNPPRERIQNLDSLPYSRHLLEMEAYNLKLDFLNLPATSIMTARGCPFNCSFCSASVMFGTNYTMRSAKNVVDEIQYCIENFKIKGIKFFDSTLTINKAHVLSLLEELKKRNIDLPWECEIRVDTVDRSLLEAMKRGGCYYVGLGVESASEPVLKTIDKGISLEQVSNVLKWCTELDLETKAFFSFGHISETWQDTEKTLAFIDRHRNEISSLAKGYGIRIYPGTQVERYAIENGLLPKDFSWSRPSKNIVEDVVFNAGVPILLQPSYGLKELRSCLYRLELKGNVDSIRSIIRNLRKIKSFRELLLKLSIVVKLAVSKH